jgi:hypothetical protein
MDSYRHRHRVTGKESQAKKSESVGCGSKHGKGILYLCPQPACFFYIPTCAMNHNGLEEGGVVAFLSIFLPSAGMVKR